MSKTPWLDAAKAETGIREVAGKRDNPKILDFYRDAGHPEIEHDETPWCAAFVGAMLKRCGYPTTGSLAARSYLKYGRKLTKPEPGCIVVFWRGSPSSWEGHVAFFVKDEGANVRVLGGNQSNAVTETTYPKKGKDVGVLGYCMPIAPTVAALREAGSTEIKQGDRVKQTAVAVATGTVAAEGVATAVPPTPAVTALPAAPLPPAIPTVDPSMVNLSEQLSILQKVGEGAHAVANLLLGGRTALILIGCALAFGLAIWLQRQRVAKHANGVPLGVAGEGESHAVV
jgi:uncharacterized protein (TIGR02594 family)